MDILLVDDRVPDPNFGAGFPRAYRLLLSLLALGHKILFLPTVKASALELDRATLAEYGVEVVDDPNQLSGRNVDVAIISRPHNMHYFLPVLKKNIPNAKFVYDTEALWFRRYDLQLEITGRLPNWAYRYDEIGLARQVDLCYVVNDVEKTILHANGVKNVSKLAHALDVHAKGLDFEQRADFLFVGGILEEDSSNEDAVWTFLSNGWDDTRNATKAFLKITGKASAPRLVTNTYENACLMGHVPDLVPLYESCRVFVASTRFATGIPWKVHEAMAHGIPCVISQLLADQLGVTHGVEAMVVSKPEDYAKHSIELYTNKDLWEKIRQNAFELIRRDCDPEGFKQILSTTLGELFAPAR
jgi:glycosyltransferase involved in cell wall biosynthesis